MSYRYSKDQFGTLNLKQGDDLVAWHDPSAILAILHDGPLLLKHGSHEAISAQHDKIVKAYNIGGMPDLADDVRMIELPVDKLTPGMIDEINACLDISGRVENLAANLERISAVEKSILPEF